MIGSVFGQNYILSGTISDADDGRNLGFVSIRLLAAPDSNMVEGGMSDENGSFYFEAENGQYWLEAVFEGYESSFSKLILLSSRQNVHLKMKRLSTTLQEVEISGKKSLVEMSLDKKIFNVGQDLSNQGASAEEIMANIPSVTVDGEGRVRLRGSSDVRILIDGKPSGLLGPDGKGLKQLQGNLIESIEVITNPSARYDAEGSGGIINIVLKKDRKEGFNGSFSLTAGYPTNLTAAINVNYRVRKINFFLNYGFGYRVNPYRGNIYQEIYRHDSTIIQLQESSGQFQGLVNNIRGGLDFYFDERNILTASYRFRRTDGERFSYFKYEDYLNNTHSPFLFTEREQYEKESEPYSEYALTYKKTFSKEEQTFTADIRYLNYWENSDQTYPETSWLPGQSQEEGNTFVQKAVNDEYENQYLIQLDYVQPIGEEGTFEAGFRGSFRQMLNDYLATEEQANGVWTPLADFDNIFHYDENIYAVYGIVANKKERFSYQLGLRAEATQIETLLEETNEANPRAYQNLFPSGHFAFHLPGQNDIQLSYSRRIRRPLYWELSPFITLSDRRNFFSGNPDLNPEYTHSIELGHLKYFEKGSLSSALFFRNSTATIQSLRLVDIEGLARSLPYNLVGQNAFGADMTFSYNLFPWWKLDANLNAYRAITDGTNLDVTFSSDTYSWFVRQTSRFNLPEGTNLQIRGNFQAPELLPQGRRMAIYTLDLAIKKDLWQQKGSLTLSLTDVFNTNRSIVLTEGESFFTDRFSQRRLRQIDLTLSYRFNQ